MNIKPTRGYVLLEPLEQEEVSSGGVALPERVKEQPAKSKVLAIGSNQYLPNGDPIEFEGKVGDIVVHKRFIDNRIKEKGKEYLIARFEDVLGVYE